jgi:integrase
MKDKITKRGVDALKPGEFIADTEVQGFIARCLPSGAVVYSLRFRDKQTGKRHWLKLERHGNITPDQARTLAKEEAGKVAGRRNPVAEVKAAKEEAAKAKAASTNTVSKILDEHVAGYLRKKGRRSADQIERCFERLVKPRIGDIGIYDLKRSDITAMLDGIETQHGDVMADRTLAYFRKALNWHAVRDGAFNSPIVKGMAKTKPKERARARVLDDDEIRSLWEALDGVDAPPAFAGFVRTLLLTATRRREAAEMQWGELTELPLHDGREPVPAWVIPGTRYKTKLEHTIPLTATMQAIIGERQEKSGAFAFSTTGGKKPLQGYGKLKVKLDRKLAEIRKRDGKEPMQRWTFHDLRRSSRSLMSRAGVSSDVAERVLGHVLPGVRGTYDRYSYLSEKLEALTRLDALVKRILNPPASNVLTLSRTA